MRIVYGLALVLVVVLAVSVRAIPLFTALPYSHYVDEGRVVQGSARLVADATWDPDFYDYPAGLLGATAAVASTKAVLWGEWGEFRSEVRRYDRDGFFDPLPTDLLLSARVLVLLSSVGVVLLVAHLGRVLGGRPVGLLAGLLAAALPALATRSATATVDAPASLFVLASIACAVRIRTSDRRLSWAIAAGGFAGLATGTKYTVGVVVLAVAVGVILDDRVSWARRLALCAAAGASAGVCFFAVSPAVLLEFGVVRSRLAQLSRGYGSKTSASYLSELLDPSEAGSVFALLALAGLVLALVRRPVRPAALVVTAFVLPFVVSLHRYSFQPFRNLYPVLAIGCATAALALITASRWAVHRLGLGRWWPAALTAVAAVGLLYLLLPVAVEQNRNDTRFVDSRSQVQTWFAGRTRCGSVLIPRELGFHPDEIDDFGCEEVRIAWATRDEPGLDPERFDFVVTSSFARELFAPGTHRELADWAERRPSGPVAVFGREPIDRVRWDRYRTTQQYMEVYRNERRPGA